MSSERTIRVSFQGERGAFSEEAACRLLGAGIEAVPFPTFDGIFAAVEAGTCDGAIVPVENTLAGSVIKNYDLLVEHDLTIVGEVILRVVHNLIAAPGSPIDGIKKVYSHPVALAQCERFFAAHPQMEAIQAYDTAGSVKLVIEGGRKDEAAIAAAGAATAWGGQILAAGIESNPQNFTRFLLLVRPDKVGAIPIAAAESGRKTSIILRIAHKPGALYRSLAAFAEEAIDLTKIESRPIEGRPWEYTFYLDFVGDREDAGVQRALTRLGAEAESLRVLGSYPRAV